MERSPARRTAARYLPAPSLQRPTSRTGISSSLETRAHGPKNRARAFGESDGNQRETGGRKVKAVAESPTLSKHQPRKDGAPRRKTLRKRLNLRRLLHDARIFGAHLAFWRAAKVHANSSANLTIAVLEMLKIPIASSMSSQASGCMTGFRSSVLMFSNTDVVLGLTLWLFSTSI